MGSKYKKLTILCLIFLLFQLTNCINNGAGLTPPMGWISDTNLNCNINETYFQQQASKLIETNLANKGYKFVILNGCWQSQSRNEESGEIVEDFQRFPNGIQFLSKSIHSKSLKLGISSDAGIKTCHNRPGSYGYEKIDAQKFAKQWQIDYLLYENCNHTVNETKFRFYLMQKSLNESKRSIFFAINDNDNNNRAWQWGSSVANSWRIIPTYDDNSWTAFLNLLQKQITMQKYASISGWNDPGPFMINSKTMTYQQKYTKFVFWCVWKSPLLIKNSLGELKPEQIDMLSNEELIAVNQDSMGVQAKRIKLEIGSTFKREVWGGVLEENKYVVVFFNRGDAETSVQISLKKDLNLTFSSYTQRDPIRHSSVGISNQDTLSSKVASHSVEVRILSIIKQSHLNLQ